MMTEHERAEAIVKGLCAEKPEGAVFQRALNAEWEVLVFPLLFGGGQLCIARIGEPGSEDSYDYPKINDALRAATEWDGINDPLDGWVRHLRSGRRRPDGTAASEKFDR